MIQLEQRHFEMFKDEARIALDFFNMADWYIVFSFSDNDEGGFANFNGNFTSRVATINLQPTWTFDEDEDEDKKLTSAYTPELVDNQVRRSAFHEVCELFLSRLSKMICDRDFSDMRREEEIHRIIRVLENRVYPLIQEKP